MGAKHWSGSQIIVLGDGMARLQGLEVSGKVHTLSNTLPWLPPLLAPR